MVDYSMVSVSFRFQSLGTVFHSDKRHADRQLNDDKNSNRIVKEIYRKRKQWTTRQGGTLTAQTCDRDEKGSMVSREGRPAVTPGGEEQKGADQPSYSETIPND